MEAARTVGEVAAEVPGAAIAAARGTKAATTTALAWERAAALGDVLECPRSMIIMNIMTTTITMIMTADREALPHGTISPVFPAVRPVAVMRSKCPGKG